MNQRLNSRDAEKLRTKRGGYTRADLEKIRVPWPPPKGWLSILQSGKPAVLPTEPDRSFPEGTRFSHNSRKPESCYHVATDEGAACKLQNSKFMQYQDTIADAPPPGKRLCTMCDTVLARETHRESIPWERLEKF